MSTSRATDILRGAMGLPAEQREAYIALRCGGDNRLRDEIGTLLRAQGEATLDGEGAGTVGPFPAEPNVPEAVTVSRGGTSPSDGVMGLGSGVRRIGRYRVVRMLGEGGMGVVYLAQQEHPQRLVALKVIRGAALSPRALRRFELESQLLGRLQHPGIAQVYEAGTASEGDGLPPLPFFAMEYIEGVPLTDDANNRGLDVRARLELLARVCDAVHHAHQKGVVHRDLKPGNVLVDTRGQPKVLDFGVARTLDSEGGSGVSMHTEAGQLLGTVPYMSPEQLGGGGRDARDVDTRSDVYTLGVILFELLTGRLPHDVSTVTLPEAVRTIADDEAAPLSSFDRSLRGDVETIAQKALEKDRERRYQSASELAEDIRRFLRDEPIAARPPSRAYQFHKFAKRNKALVFGVAGVMVVLAGGVVASSTLAVIAKRNEVTAERAAADAMAVTQFLQDMLASANPDGDDLERGAGSVRVQAATTVREVLDRSSAGIAALDERPLVQIPLLNILARSYRSLGELDKARAHAEACLERTKVQFGEGSLETVRARTLLGSVLLEQNKLPEAEGIWLDTVKWLETAPGAEEWELEKARSELGRVYFEQGKAQEGLPLAERAFERLTALKGPTYPATMQCGDVLSTILSNLGDFKRAEDVVRRNLEARETAYGKDSTTAAYTMTTLANALQKQGKDAEAIDLLKRVLVIRRGTLAPDHPRLQLTVVNLAVALVGSGRQAEGLPLLREAFEATRSKLGEAHPRTLSAMGNLAYCLEDLGELDEAERLFRRSVELGREEQARTGESADNSDFWLRINNLGALLLKAGKLREADAAFAEAIERSAAKLPPDHYVLAIFHNNRGRSLTRLGDFAKAEPLLKSSHALIERKFGQEHARTRRSTWRLAELYKAMGQTTDEAHWRGRVPAGYADDR